MPKPLLAQKPQHSRERKRPTVPLGRLCPFTHRLCCWGNQGAALQTLPHPSFLKVQGARTDVCMWFCLGLSVWTP